MKLRKIALTALLCTSLTVGSAMAAKIEKPECVAPAKPGGGFDLTCRVAQIALKPQLSELMQVTFMPGGIGAVAINMFNTTRVDDPNSIVAFSSGSLLNMATGKYGEWNEKDVKFVATAGADYGAVIVRNDSKFKTLADVMEAFKAGEGSVVVGAGGSVGSQDWIKAALLLKAVGKDPKKMRYVAFDGGGDAYAGLLGGSIEIYTGDVGEMAGHLGDGTVRILAVMSDNRLPEPFDKYPTAKELGYDVVWTILRGYYMGKKVDAEAYSSWVNAFKAAYGTADFTTIQKEKGLLPLNLAGADLDAEVTKQMATLRAIAKESGLIQ